MIERLELSKMPEVAFDPRSIAVVTATFYPRWYSGEVGNHNLVDKTRGDLAIKTLLETQRRGFQYVVFDASNQEFQEELGRFGIRVLTERDEGMSASRRQAFKEASKLDGVNVLCWTEPEKVSLVRDCLSDAVVPILKGEADVVVPKRGDASFSTYPNYQVRYENKANTLWNGILRSKRILPKESEDLDVWFGPRVFKNDLDLVGLFLKKYKFLKRDLKLDEVVDPELWPNAIFLPIVAALYKGFKVKGVEVPYIHSEEQTRIERNDPQFVRKRQIQLKNIIVSTIHYIRMLEESEDPTRMRKSRLVPAT